LDDLDDEQRPPNITDQDWANYKNVEEPQDMKVDDHNMTGGMLEDGAGEV
jgi:hypothetical protein